MRSKVFWTIAALALPLLSAPVFSAAPGSAASTPSTTYQAESSMNTLAGGARVVTCSACSGAKKVGFVGNNKGTLQFNGVMSRETEFVSLTLSYADGSVAGRTAQLSVNGAPATTLTFTPTGSFLKVRTMTVPVGLNAGANTITLSNPTAYAPDFDKISISPPPPTTGPTADQLRAKVATCKQISKGLFKTDADAPTATIPVCGGVKGAVFWKADMDVDCDGQVTAQCNKKTDCCFGGDTTFHQTDGKPLSAAALPYVVIPTYSKIWDPYRSNIQGGAVVAVVFHDHVTYAVFGDTMPDAIIGESSYATALSLGINPDPSNGGTDEEVTYIVFQGTKVSPIESHDAAIKAGLAAAKKFLASN